MLQRPALLPSQGEYEPAVHVFSDVATTEPPFEVAVARTGYSQPHQV